MRPKYLRILALISALIIIGLNIVALVFAIIPNSELSKLSFPLFVISIFIAIVLFANLKIVEFLKDRKEENSPNSAKND